MKIYDTQDINNSFSRAIDAMQSDDIDAQNLGVFFGSLSVSISMRSEQLKLGIAKSSNKNFELAKLQQASGFLKAKINTSTVSEMSQQIMAAYKAYGASN